MSQFTFTRTGPTNAPLKVYFSLGGTAQAGSDFANYLVPNTTIPAGATFATLPLTVFNDEISEGPETVTLGVELPTLSKRQAGTPNEYTVFYPGWERTVVVGQEVWAQTHADYVLGLANSATVTIADDDVPVSLALQVLTVGSLQIQLTGQPGRLRVLEESVNLQNWTPIRTNVLTNAFWTIDGLTLDALNKFFRGFRQ